MVIVPYKNVLFFSAKVTLYDYFANYTLIFCILNILLILLRLISNKKTKMNLTSKYLTNYGIRPSVQRIAIMEYLQQNLTHPTVEEVFENLREKIPTLSKTTVYNTLKLFIENGAAGYIGIDEKNARFDAVVKPHAHFRCEKCGKILDIPMDMNKLLPDNFKGKITETFCYLKGLCEECKGM
jgi:Fe2+ or Zn2+ uptake regulation protein